MKNNEEDRNFLDLIIQNLVEYKDSVKISRSVDERGVLFLLEVDQRDMGKIIGKNGATANAIRLLLKVFGVKNNSRISLKIQEPVKSFHKSEVSSDIDRAIENLRESWDK